MRVRGSGRKFARALRDHAPSARPPFCRPAIVVKQTGLRTAPPASPPGSSGRGTAARELRRSARVRWTHRVVPIVAILAAVVLLQLASGAGSYVPTDPDEPSHFISGLFVRDYLASGFRLAPAAYGRDYYAHYPKLAIGNWPPAFYALQGVWMLVFPADPRSVLALIALLTAGTALIVQRLLAREVGEGYGWLGAGTLLLLPPLARYASAVMLELPLTFLTLLALWAWTEYLRTRRASLALAFAAASTVAVLTKGNALSLALLPVLTVAIGRQWWVLRSRVLWGAALAIALIAGPWTWRHMDTVRDGWASATFSGEYVVRALGYYATHVALALGPVLFVLACVGAWRARRAWREPSTAAPIFSCAVALVCAVVLFHALIPSGQTRRHLIVAYPALALLVALGTKIVIEALARRGVRPRLAALGLCIAILMSLAPARLWRPQRDLGELTRAAAMATDAREPKDERGSLIVSDALGEGIYVQAVALRDPARPHDVVWRGSKLLSSATWGGSDYRLRAERPEEVLALLDQAGIRTLVYDRTAPSPHATLLAQTIATFPERFLVRARLPLLRYARRVPDGVMIYEYRGQNGPGADGPRLRQVPGYEGVEEYGGREQRVGAARPG